MDGCCAPAEHTDPYATEGLNRGLAGPRQVLLLTGVSLALHRYARALKERSIPCKYLRRDFGDHGFGLEGGWTDACVEWLRASGFGKPLPSDKGQKRARP